MMEKKKVFFVQEKQLHDGKVHFKQEYVIYPSNIKV